MMQKQPDQPQNRPDLPQNRPDLPQNRPDPPQGAQGEFLITQQLSSHHPDRWVAAPPPGVPYGLEHLNGTDLLFVSQKVEWLEIFTGFETENKYAILNKNGQKVYYARENSDCCERMWCGALRSFNMSVVDNHNSEVLRFDRPLACASCCCPCCLQTIAVMSPTGELFGSVQQLWTYWTPLFNLLDANGDTVLRIKGPKIHCGYPSFRIYTADGQFELGKIKKHWTGLLQEIFTDADNFAISFPLDLDVRMKAVLLGALFLIDFMYFENNQKDSC